MTDKNKIMLITGATGGIGRELCIKFAQAQWNIILVGRNQGKLYEISKLLTKKYKVRTWVVCHDLREEAAAYQIIQDVKKLNLSVHLLINAAGLGVYGDFLDRDISLHHELIQVNIRGLTELCYLFGKEMRKEKSGYIVNLSSISGFFPGPYLSTYYASKAFILSFSLALEKELRPFHIPVLAICPGVTNTCFYEKAKADLNWSYLLKRMNPNSPKWTANKIYNLIYKKRTGYKILGLRNKLIQFFSKFLPVLWLVKIVSFAQAKKKTK